MQALSYHARMARRAQHLRRDAIFDDMLCEKSGQQV